MAITDSSFNSTRHICFQQPNKIHTMSDLGLPEDNGVSSMGISEPFQLFSEEAIKIMRDEILRPDVLKNCSYSSNLSPLQLRGFAREYAPFVEAAWKDPLTLSIVSKVAGIELVPAMDFEIGHINLSFPGQSPAPVPKDSDSDSDSDEQFSVDWHRDSYPFVCVVMLSDCSKMLGGETAIKTGAGEVVKVRGPQMGSAVILQGRYITHRALRALGANERITMVTSFRPKSPLARDDTTLKTVRPISDLKQLYYQFAEYRLGILEQRLQHQRDMLRIQMTKLDSFDLQDLKAFLLEQEEFMAHTREEMVDEADVTMGEIDPSI